MGDDLHERYVRAMMVLYNVDDVTRVHSTDVRPLTLACEQIIVRSENALEVVAAFQKLQERLQAYWEQESESQDETPVSYVTDSEDSAAEGFFSDPPDRLGDSSGDSDASEYTPWSTEDSGTENESGTSDSETTHKREE